MAEPLRLLTPTGMLGYGYPAEQVEDALDAGVDAIIVDSGSTDPGPYLLGSGATLVPEDSYLRDLRPLVVASGRRRIPLLVTSAGGAGTRAQVDGMVELVTRIAREEDLSLRIAAVYADLDADDVCERLENDQFAPSVRGDLPTAADVRQATAIVAQMGIEPLLPLVSPGAGIDVVIAGRAYDPAPFAAFCISRGVQPAIAWHVGKILECGAACAEPKGGAVLAHVYPDAFEVAPLRPDARCTPITVAAHSLYEKGQPEFHAGPSGVLDVRASAFEAVDDRTVRVTGSRFVPSDRLTLKVEAARQVGFRSIFLGAIRDPILIAQIDSFLEEVTRHVERLQPPLADGTAQLRFHVYGKDGVMGDWEPRQDAQPHEIAILGEVLAPTQEMASAVCASTRIAVLHKSYPGQKATAGNLALPLTPLETPLGPVYAFSVYHVMDAAGFDPFATRYVEVTA